MYLLLKTWWFSTVLLVFGGVRIKIPLKFTKQKPNTPSKHDHIFFPTKANTFQLENQHLLPENQHFPFQTKKTHTQTIIQPTKTHPSIAAAWTNQSDGPTAWSRPIKGHTGLLRWNVCGLHTCDASRNGWRLSEAGCTWMSCWYLVTGLFHPYINRL